MSQLTVLDQQVAGSPESPSASEWDICQPCVLLPLLENALPLVRLRIEGQLRRIDRRQVVVECSLPRAVSRGSSVAVGVTGADSRAKFAAIVVDDVWPLENNQVSVAGHLGGPLSKILEQEVLCPSLNPGSLRFEYDISERILDRLADAGVLDRTMMDRIQVCPNCGGLPVYRYACHSCHSSRVSTDELVHHFACAYVASVDHYRDGNRLRCPKCQMGPLIVGSDFEYLPGLHTCHDCSRVGSQLSLRAKCTLCQHDFSANESASYDLIGFQPNRLDSATLSLL